MAEKKYEIDRKTLNQVQWRSWTYQASFNYERMGGLGYCQTVIPALKKLYPNEEDFKAALKRNIVLFNTTAQCVPFIVGVALSMEEKYANERNFDPEAINSVKVSLMSPLAGVGDAFFQGILRIIASAIGVSMVNAGNGIGVIVAFLLFNIISLTLRISGLYYGYNAGTKLLETIAESDVMKRISYIGGIIGMMVVGGMVASMIKITTSLSFETNSGVIALQDLFDSIGPKLLPLLSFMLVVWLMNEKKVKPTVIIYSMLVIGIVLTYLGVFAY